MITRKIALFAVALGIGFALPTGLAATAQAGPALPTCTQEAIDTLVTPEKCTWTVVYSNGPVTTYILDTRGNVKIDYRNSSK